MTTSFPAYGAKLGTKYSIPRPSQLVAGRQRPGLNLPMPAVISTAPQLTEVSSSSATTTPSSVWVSVAAVRPSRYVGSAVAACSTSASTRSRPLTVGKPATSRICFSGYIAVIWPPSSGSESTTATRSPRKPA